VTAKDLDQAYVLLSQTISGVPRESQELFLAKVVLLLLASHPEPEVALAAIRDAERGGERPAAVAAKQPASTPAP
jgi:hypothetical protein